MNYDEIYQNFKESSINRTEEPENPFFTLASDKEKEIITYPYNICIKSSSVWSEEDLDDLKAINVPTQLIEFYSQLNPCNVPMNYAGIRLLSLENIQNEYTELAPGAYLIKFGFLVIATTIGGNPLFIDLTDSQAGVYISDYTFLSFDAGSKTLEFSYVPDKLYDILYQNIGAADDVNYETIKRLAAKVEDSFEMFIRKLSMNQYGSKAEDLESLLE